MPPAKQDTGKPFPSYDAPLVPLIQPSNDGRSAIEPLPLTLSARDSHLPAFGSSLKNWRCTTYAFPAAYPRSILGSNSRSKAKNAPPRAAGAASATAAGNANGRMSKEQLEKWTFEYSEQRRAALIAGVDVDSPESTQGAAFEHDQPLWITVNRYSTTSSTASHAGHGVSGHGDNSEVALSDAEAQSGVTLIVAHPNGFSKETWEPTLSYLVKEAEAGKSQRIDEIWSLDMVNHGDAAVLNRQGLDDHFDWSDNGRDILQFVLNYLPEAERGAASDRTHVHVEANKNTGITKDQLRTTASDDTVSRGASSSSSSRPDDASLFHWGSSASAGSSSVGSSSTSSLQYQPKMNGWITEIDGMAATAAPGRGKSDSSRGRPASGSAAASTMEIKILTRQTLPVDMSDANLLDRSRSSTINNRERPLTPTRWRGRDIVLLGHSVGAAGMIFTASTFAHLFRQLIIVDPTVFPAVTPRWEKTIPLVHGSLIRRDAWPSRDAALASFRKNKNFYGRWEDGVLERYAAFALVESSRLGVSGDSADGVTLKCDKMQETYVYADYDNYGSKRAFHRIAWLPTTGERQIAVAIIRADVGQSTIPEEFYSPYFGDAAKNAEHSRIAGAGHLIAQEKPKELGEEIARVLVRVGRPRPAGNALPPITKARL